VNHKKRSTLFLIITLPFLGQFLYFFVPVETGMNAQQRSQQNLPLQPNTTW